MYVKQAKFSDLLGKTLISIENKKDKIFFKVSDTEIYLAFHIQDCCESVLIEDINGDLNDLIGVPILQAEETTNSKEPIPHEYVEYFTWTFYKLATIKGYVTIRWLGESNGYYSESVDFYKSNDEGKFPDYLEQILNTK